MTKFSEAKEDVHVVPGEREPRQAGLLFSHSGPLGPTHVLGVHVQTEREGLTSPIPFVFTSTHPPVA